MKLFIFGATGDLVKRKVVPALVALGRGETAMRDLQIIALGRKKLSDQEYEKFVCEDCFAEFETRPKYEQVSFDGALTCHECEQYLTKGETTYFYSALPPHQIELVLRYVAVVMHDGYDVRLLLEKPFGTSLADARKLADLIETLGLGERVYLADHYLFKDAIYNMVYERLPEFEKLTIVSLEELGLEQRAQYYDSVGALRDMVQSHFLNIAFKLSPDLNSKYRNIKISKFKRGQYADYVQELGKPSETETYVDLEFVMDGREYHFETGKKFEKKVSYLELDNERFDLEKGSDPYARMLQDFLAPRSLGEVGVADKRDHFPSVEQSIRAWQIIEKIEERKTGASPY